MRLAIIFDGAAALVRDVALALILVAAALAGPAGAAATEDPEAPRAPEAAETADTTDASDEAAPKTTKKELVPFKIEDGATLKVIKKPLGGLVGDAESGRRLFVDRAKGNCLACHAVAAIPELKFQGDVGNALDGVASRFNEAELRLILVDPKVNYPRTVMPAYYRIQGLTRVHPELASGPVLNAQEVEDLLAFLMTLK